MVLMTRMAGGRQELFDPQSPPANLDPQLAEAAVTALRTDKSRVVEIEGENWFVQNFSAPLRMIVVGAVHIAQALVPMAALAGYAVTVIDPRRAFASDVRFPGVTVSTEWPDVAMSELKPDSRSAVVTLTHDPKLDDPALEVALKSDAFYIGCLGSKRTHTARLERLDEAGLGEVGRSRIKGPVGLNIGASSPAEIAISILGEVTQTLREDNIKPAT